MKRSANVTFALRRATRQDCEACQRLGRVPEITIAPNWYLPLEYYHRIVRGRHIFLVATMNRKIVGFVIAEKIEAGFLGQYLVVRKDFRQLGVGTALMARMEKEAKSRGAYFLLGYAVAKSQGMQRLLKHLGYRRGQLTYEWSKGLTQRSRRAPKKKV